MRFQSIRLIRKVLAPATCLGLAIVFGGQTAQAQYGTSFYYSNPRTGFMYSQGLGVGNHSAYGGFSYSRNGRTYSAGSGYRGQSYYQNQYYQSPRTIYGYRGYYGRRW